MTAKLAVSECAYAYAACGMVVGQYANTARNLAAYGRQVIAESGPEIGNGRGVDHTTYSVGGWLWSANPAPLRRVRPGPSRSNTGLRE